MITPREIRIVLLTVFVGVALWFVNAGARDMFLQYFPGANTFYVGLAMILVLLFAYKFRGFLPFKV